MHVVTRYGWSGGMKVLESLETKVFTNECDFVLITCSNKNKIL